MSKSMLIIPINSSTYRVNPDIKILDNILYEVGNHDIPL